MAKRRARGDGAVYFDDKRKLYIGQIGLGVDENGKRKRKTVYGKTKAEVKEKLKAVEYQVYEGTFVNASGITLYQLAKQIITGKLNQGEIKETSYYRSMETLKQFQAIYNTPVQAVDETLIKSVLLSKIEYSQSAIDKMFGLLKTTFTEAIKRRIISENPMEHIKKPKTKNPSVKVRALTKDEQSRLMTVLLTEDINYSRQMLLSLLTGMRMGEVNALEVEDVNMPFGIISINKTISRGQKGEALISSTTKTQAGTRRLPMTATVREIITDCIGDKTKGYIFRHNNKLITTNQVNAQFNRVLKKYDILDTSLEGRIDLHSLRHTYGTRCIEGGMSFKALQELMGHTDIRVTMNTYCDATNDFINDNIAKVTQYMENIGLSIQVPEVKKALA